MFICFFQFRNISNIRTTIKQKSLFECPNKNGSQTSENKYNIRHDDSKAWLLKEENYLTKIFEFVTIPSFVAVIYPVTPQNLFILLKM